MSFSWDKFHSDCRHVSNASIICEDGVIFTHKLVLATISKLLEQILSDIPAADEVTFYLKAFEKSEVEEFFNDLLHKRDCSHYELCSIFGVDSSFEQFPVHGGPRGKKGRARPRQILPRPELGAGAEELKTSSIKSDIEKDDLDNKVEVKTEDKTEDTIGDSETLDIESNESIDKLKKIHEHIDKVTEEKVKEFEKGLVKNPKTKSDYIQNRKIEKKIKHEKAMAFYKSGQALSVHHAAKMYGLCHKTLKKFVLSGGSYRGGGSYLLRFSKEEEKVIVDRALKLSEGNALTFKILREVILEEAEVIKINQSERSEQMLFTRDKLHYFAYALADRNGIKNLVRGLRILQLCNIYVILGYFERFNGIAVTLYTFHRL